MPGPKPGSVGPAVDPTLTTKVIEFNDVDDLQKALADGDVAAVRAEPALTNIGIVPPSPGYHDALRRITRETGTMLIIDETHTICVAHIPHPSRPVPEQFLKAAVGQLRLRRLVCWEGRGRKSSAGSSDARRGSLAPAHLQSCFAALTLRCGTRSSGGCGPHISSSPAEPSRAWSPDRSARR